MGRPVGHQTTDAQTALRAAVELVGSQAAMARLLGISQPTVWNWLDKGKLLPAEHVHAVATATGISKERLRPDIFAASPLDRATSDNEGARA